MVTNQIFQDLAQSAAPLSRLQQSPEGAAAVRAGLTKHPSELRYLPGGQTFPVGIGKRLNCSNKALLPASGVIGASYNIIYN